MAKIISDSYQTVMEFILAMLTIGPPHSIDQQYMKQLIYGLCFGLVIVVPHLSSAQESLFDEGVYKEIRAEDITPEMQEWARSTAETLKNKLDSLRDGNIQVPEKRAALEKVIQDSVAESKEVRDLLLMRYHLNRTLALSSLFPPEKSILAINYVLIPGIKRAIKLYKDADLPYLMAHQNLPAGEIERPAYAYFVKTYLPDLLTTANFNPNPNGTFQVLKFAIVWTFHDLNQSVKRQDFGSLFKNLSDKFEEIKDIQSSNDKLNTQLKQFILDTYHAIQVEKEFEELLKLEKRKKEITQDKPSEEKLKMDAAASFVPNFENGEVVLSHAEGVRIQEIMMSPDNRYVASHAKWYDFERKSHEEVTLYDLLEKHEVSNFPTLSISRLDRQVGFSPDAHYFYITRYGEWGKERILLYNLKTQETDYLDIPGVCLERVKMSPSGNFMVVTGIHYKEGGSVHLVDLQTKQIIKIIQFDPIGSDWIGSMLDHIQEEVQVEISKDGRLIFSANKKALKVYDVQNGRVILEDGLSVEEGYESDVRNFVWDEEGKILYANSNTSEGIVKKYDFSKVHMGNIPVSILNLPHKPSKVVDCDPQGQYLEVKKGNFSTPDTVNSIAAAKKGFCPWENRSFIFVNPQIGNQIWPGEFEPFRGEGAVLSANGNFIFANAQIFDFRERKKFFNIDKPIVYPSDIKGGGFSPDGTEYLAYTGDKAFKKYNLKTKAFTSIDLSPFVYKPAGSQKTDWIEEIIWPNNFLFVLTSQGKEDNILRFWKVTW